MMENKVVVIPLKPEAGTKDVNYLMVEKPLYASGSTQLEFPVGNVGQKEMLEDAAKRVFLQETGYDPTWVKFLYAFFPNPQGSNYRVSVFLGLALGESESAHATVELDGDALLKRIRENEIVDGTSLAALSAILLQGEKAKSYLIQELTTTNEEAVISDREQSE